MTDQEAKAAPPIRFRQFNNAWTGRRLGDVSTIGDADHWMPATTADGIPYVMTGDFLGVNEIDFKNAKRISEKDYEQLSKKIKPECGDILFARYASIGSVRLIKTTEKFIASYSCAIIKGNNSFNSDYLFSLLQSGSIKKQVEQLINTGSQGNVGIESLKNLTCSFPSDREQQKVGELFQELDRLIWLHQRKSEKLIALKRAMLQKMFPQLDEGAPCIRFTGFQGSWGDESVENAMENIANNSLSRADLNHRSGLAKNVHYGDILTKFGEVLDAQTDDLPMISSDAIVAKLSSSRLKDGDIVMADAAEDDSVGKCAELNNIGNQTVIAGLHTIGLRPRKSFAPFFLGYYLNSDAFQTQILPIMQGTKVLSISKTAIKRLRIRFPTDRAEQQKIGAYFHSLNLLIGLHARQIQKFRQIKASCLDTMFL